VLSTAEGPRPFQPRNPRPPHVVGPEGGAGSAGGIRGGGLGTAAATRGSGTRGGGGVAAGGGGCRRPRGREAVSSRAAASASGSWSSAVTERVSRPTRGGGGGGGIAGGNSVTCRPHVTLRVRQGPLGGGQAGTEVSGLRRLFGGRPRGEDGSRPTSHGAPAKWGGGAVPKPQGGLGGGQFFERTGRAREELDAAELGSAVESPAAAAVLYGPPQFAPPPPSLHAGGEAGTRKGRSAAAVARARAPAVRRGRGEGKGEDTGSSHPPQRQARRRWRAGADKKTHGMLPRARAGTDSP